MNNVIKGNFGQSPEDFTDLKNLTRTQLNEKYTNATPEEKERINRYLNTLTITNIQVSKKTAEILKQDNPE